RMIHVVLSDFSADELARLRKEREDAFDAEIRRSRDFERDSRVTVAERQRQYHDAWAARRYVHAVWLWFRIVFAPTPELPPTRTMPAMTEREHILEAGAAGQRSVVEHLAAQLDDRWIALSGYFNFKGE